MTIKIFKEIAFNPDPDLLLDELRIKDKKDLTREFFQMLNEAEGIAKPKALFRKALIQAKGKDWVLIEGERFESRILRVNLENSDFVFPAVATCGIELDSWSSNITNILYKFWAESIKDAALTSAITQVQNHLKDEYKTGFFSLMTPGSLEDWPLTEQKKLFRLLGKSTETINVSLTDKNYMVPVKTISSLAFPTDEAFFSCQLCPREDCPKRRALFEAHLMEKKYSPNTCDSVDSFN